MTFDLARPSRHPGAGSTRRLELLDSLRGFALFGVPLFNLRSSSLLEFIVTSIALLALLFGLGFAMQAVRPGEKPNSIRLPVRRMLQESVAHRRLWVRLLKVALVVSLATTAPLMLWDFGGAGVRVMRLLHQIALSLFCMAAFVLLFQQTRWRHWLRKLAPMGCMALTNWLAQALLGLGLFYALGPSFGFLLGIAVLQAMLSCWWLARWSSRQTGQLNAARPLRQQPLRAEP
ncbi:putative membrane protein YeiB [Variovorax boronicumulans]|uniref:DUF418 domain-containing protein n=1 Tax=Variovorax boronicumulans TaxID=436515 RepID=UPI002784F47B|nr:DUF418 domain-containing protein [Variovorax boronicumulans]MDQ0081876.1 putative membrane protein YeiB [Variovorax boronicumulans]